MTMDEPNGDDEPEDFRARVRREIYEDKLRDDGERQARRRAVEVLNRALAADAKAVEHLFSVRAVCTDVLRDDPTIQVDVTTALPGILFERPVNVVSVLGILNGIFGIDERGWGHIAAVYEEGKLVRFEERAAQLPAPPADTKA